jgi:23S rRNA (cytosine1962-C5)-methyltransferase
MRETRARVQALAAGRTVLNLFAYTCAFGVAACAGGATRALNLDAARPALRWGMENYALNGLPADPYDFVYGDAFDWLGRLARRGTRFDLVIADPPSYSSVNGRRFTVARDYAALTAACARVAAPGGLLLCCANEEALPRRAFRAACLRGVGEAGRSVRAVAYDGAPVLDFPTLPGQDSHLKVLLLNVD